MKKVLMAAVVLATAAGTTPAFAHAELKSSTPQRGASLDRPPGDLVMDFTEPPTASASVVVTDGCKQDVAGEVETEGTELRATLDDGEPGRWKVEFDVVSGLDGHPTSGSFAFDVAGERDCRAAPDAAADAKEESGSTTLFLIFGGLALAIIAAAALTRNR